MKQDTGYMVASYWGEPGWAAEEIHSRIRRAKTALARHRLRAVIDAMWDAEEQTAELPD